MAGGVGFLIFDANVLIDYCKVDRTLLRKVSVGLAPICIPRPVLDEVDQLTEKMCSPLKIELVEYTYTELEVVSQRCGILSMQDRLCLELAQDRQGICVTNDKPLRRNCDSASTSVQWGMQPLLKLVQTGKLSVRAATKAIETMQAKNPFITQELIDAFLNQLHKFDQARKSRMSQ